MYEFRGTFGTTTLAIRPMTMILPAPRLASRIKYAVPGIPQIKNPHFPPDKRRVGIPVNKKTNQVILPSESTVYVTDAVSEEWIAVAAKVVSGAVVMVTVTFVDCAKP